MEAKIVRWIITALGWMSALSGAGLFVYAAYAVATGSIELSAKFSSNTFAFREAPGPFIFSLLIYVAGGAMCVWIAKALLIDEPRWRRGRGIDR